MSVIFGICRERGGRLQASSFEQLAKVTERYGADGTTLNVAQPIAMGFQAFHTSSRSHLEQQPCADETGNMLTMDGRLDNHAELASIENVKLGSLSDSMLALKAFERWGCNCFSHLVGDWALAIWSARDHVLYLARDHAGSRTLFCSVTNDEIIWSSYLETFMAKGSFPDLETEYIARVLAGQQIGDLTPFKGIRAIPPAHYIAIRDGHMTVHSHWQWITDKRIVYRSKTDYDEHFLDLFRRSVQRRTEPGAPILAELSGGIDSSAIVCIADQLASGHDRARPLDTVSYYVEDEPDWDERPYFAAVERHRNVHGIHVNFTPLTPTYEPLQLSGRSYPYPVGDRVALQKEELFERCVGSGRFRVILSGIGGDELLGGVPTPFPELADYLREGRLWNLVSEAARWCLVDRQPLLYMLWRTVRFTSSLYFDRRVRPSDLPPWLNPEVLRLCSKPATPPTARSSLLFARPSTLVNGEAWWSVLESLQHLSPRLLGCYEYRYPYLDRDFVDFLHQIPRHELIQPGRRRILMRRALGNIVPAEIIERKRKAFVSRGPITNLRKEQQKIEGLFADSLVSALGMINRDELLGAFRAELSGERKWIGYLRRLIDLELSLRYFKAEFSCLRKA